MLCSVIIPTRNRPFETKRAINSILAQRNSNEVQIVVVDDCSDIQYELDNLRPNDLFIKLITILPTFPISCIAAMIIGLSTVGFTFCMNSICLIFIYEFYYLFY